MSTNNMEKVQQKKCNSVKIVFIPKRVCGEMFIFHV